MSFTAKVKNEILETMFTKTELLACLSGFVRNNLEKSEKNLFLSNENPHIIQFLQKELQSFLEVPITMEKKEHLNFSKNVLQMLILPQNSTSFLEKIGFEKQCVYLESPPLYLVDGNAEIRAYLKGVFLAKGSVNDPKTSRYHMEILIEKPKEAVFVQKLMNVFGLNAKLLTRDKGYMVYLKEAESISDFLKILGTTKAVLYYEDVRIYRNQKNYTNRLNNCEQANVDKIVETALEQLKDIDIIRKKMGIELLDEKTKEALIYREKYKESSLKELAEIISIETGRTITKSGLSHRFRKIKMLAKKLEENEKS